MSGIATQWVRRRPVTMKAVQFAGTEGDAMAILEWMRETGADYNGHFRAGVGDEPGALFIPTDDQVWRVNKGDWVIRDGAMFWLTPPEQFGGAYEVVECLAN